MMDMTGMDQTGAQGGAGGYMNRWYDGSDTSHTGITQDYYNMAAQAMHCAYGNNMAGGLPIYLLISFSAVIQTLS